MDDQEYLRRLQEIEDRAQEQLNSVVIQAQKRVCIPQSRRVRYTHLIDAIVAMIVEPAREQIESEMKRQSEDVEREFYQSEGIL